MLLLLMHLIYLYDLFMIRLATIIKHITEAQS